MSPLRGKPIFEDVNHEKCSIYLPGMKCAICCKEQKFNLIAIEKINGCKTEPEAHKVLKQYPWLFRNILSTSTGHHGLWFRSKPYIKPPGMNKRADKGGIPDFLVAGKNSGGLNWFIVELKSPTDNLFNDTGDAFSTIANKGLNQLVDYLQYASKSQASLRESLGIRDFSTPYGILIIGREQETTDEKKCRLKSYWNSVSNKIQIISYSRIARAAEGLIEFPKKTE